jgi:predicted transcriptional regulator
MHHLLTPETPGTTDQLHLASPAHNRTSGGTAMPGSGKQSADVQQQIIEFLEAGIDPTTIHRRLKVGRSSIYRMKRSLQQHGTAYAPPETNKKNGRPKVLTAEQEQVGFRLVTSCLSDIDKTSTSWT